MYAITPHSLRRWKSRQPLGRRRFGFTVIEFVVVLCSVLLLLAFLLPRIRAAQMAAQNVRCLNNLKNLSLGMHVYHDAMTVFPPGYVERDRSDEEGGPGWGWGAQSLFALENYQVQSTIDFSRPVNEFQGLPQISIKNCSLDNPDTLDRPAFMLQVRSSYVGVAGVGSFEVSPHRMAGPGVFGCNSSVRLEDILDGASQTMLIGERRSSLVSASGGRADSMAVWPGVYPDLWRQNVDGMDESPVTLVLGTVGDDQHPEWRARPNDGLRIAGLSSAHEGGMNVALADGSVRWMSNQIDPDLYRSMGQIADLYWTRSKPVQQEPPAAKP